MNVASKDQLIVEEQEKFYQDSTFSLMLLAVFSLILAIGLAGFIVLFHPLVAPSPLYFPASAQGALIAQPPLSERGIGTPVLLNWVVEAMMASNTFNFVNYAAALDAASIYYTPDGYASYKSALDTAKIVDRVIKKKLILKATPTDAPQILLEKPLAGRYMWKIKLPMKFSYQNVTTDIYDLMDVTLIVMRVPTTQSPNGVSILKFDLELTQNE